ncbi:hypothetical protein [Moorena producens]
MVFYHQLSEHDINDHFTNGVACPLHARFCTLQVWAEEISFL